jgi:hypothetical protein
VTSLSLGEEKEVLQLSLQHNLQIFSIALPQPPLLDISLSLERLAHATGETFATMLQIRVNFYAVLGAGSE